MVRGERRYALKKPCPKCPFRTDVTPYLRPERAAEIAYSIQGGSEFPCHQTTVEVEGEDGMTHLVDNPSKSIVCAGSIIVMEKQATPNQMLRIAERIGSYDPSTMDMDAPVYGSFAEWQRSYTPEGEEGETCEIVDSGCLAPAGYAIGGGIVEGTEYVDDHCGVCGRACCENCGEVIGSALGDIFTCNECIEEGEMV